MSATGNFITDDHLGAAVNISVWLGFTITGLAVLTKVCGKIWRRDSMPLGSDDIILFMTLVVALSYSVIVSRQVTAGLGTAFEEISNLQKGLYEKLGYTSDFLYILTLSSAKVASFLFALKLGAMRHVPRIAYAGMTVTTVWFMISILLVAFQCQVPLFWEIYSGRCTNQFGLWTFIEVTNTCIDVCLVVALNFLVRDILVKRTKYVLWTIFSLRLLTIPGMIIRLVFLKGHKHGAFARGDAQAAIATAAAMNLSVLVTVIPFLKPFIEQLQPGWSTSDIRHGLGYNISPGTKNRSIVVSFSDRFPMGSVVASRNV